MTRGQFIVLLLCGMGCAASVPKDPEAGFSDEDKADALRSSTDHGEFEFDAGGVVQAELTRSAQFHFWTFRVNEPATVSFETKSAGTAELDTVMYLYREQPNGRWGSYIARHDDTADSFWAVIERDLEPGNYRVLVRGYSAREIGEFLLQGNCPGGACREVPALCTNGTVVAGEPVFSSATDGLECLTPTEHCVTNDRSNCPRLFPRPPGWCADGTIMDGAASFISSSDGMECRLPGVHCVTKDHSSCPQLSPRPPGWCADGTVVQVATRFIPSADGLECALPSVHCVTRDAAACPSP